MSDGSFVDVEFSLVRAAVLDVLSSNVRSRNDDHWLYFYVCERLGFDVRIKEEQGTGDEYIQFRVLMKDWFKLPKQSTVHRVRRELQNTNGQFLPTDPNVLVRRRIKEDFVRAYYVGAKDEHIYSTYRELRYNIR